MSSMEAKKFSLERKPAPLQFNIIALLGIFHVLAISSLWFFSVEGLLALFVSHYFFIVFGIVTSIHKYLSHRAFSVSKPILHWFLVMSSTACMQGSPLFWAYTHRIHHTFSDTDKDPHNSGRGFFWSHMGWMLVKERLSISPSELRGLVADWKNDPAMKFANKYYWEINFGFLGFLLGVCLLFGRPDLFLWIGPARIVTVWHTVWSVNSILHNVWPFKKKPTHGPIDLPIWHLILPGDAAHATHHRHPKLFLYRPSDRFFDVGYWVVRLWEQLGWATIPKQKGNVVVVSHSTPKS